MQSYKVGLVLGKFMPPHKGHEYLFRFAKQYCDELVIVVDCLKGQTIAPALRKQWIEELVSGVRVVALDQFMPQDPAETAEFWNIWKDALYKAVGRKPDVLVAAMDYGWKLAEVLDCPFVQCDISRESVPISATEIRERPMANWKYIADSARGHFMKKVTFMGPESTGKSTCAQQIAKYFDTVYVPEYAKAVIASQDGNFFEHNVEEVAVAQVRSERALARMSNRLMACDTNALTTLIWAEVLYGRHPVVLDELVKSSHYDATFLFEVENTEWVADAHRKVLTSASDNAVRAAFLQTCREWLDHFSVPYVLVRGTHEERFKTCKDYCQQLLID